MENWPYLKVDSINIFYKKIVLMATDIRCKMVKANKSFRNSFVTNELFFCFRVIDKSDKMSCMFLLCFILLGIKFSICKEVLLQCFKCSQKRFESTKLKHNLFRIPKTKYFCKNWRNWETELCEHTIKARENMGRLRHIVEFWIFDKLRIFYGAFVVGFYRSTVTNENFITNFTFQIMDVKYF